MAFSRLMWICIEALESAEHWIVEVESQIDQFVASPTGKRMLRLTLTP